MTSPAAVHACGDLTAAAVEAQNARLAEIRRDRAIQRFLDANFTVTKEFVGWKRQDFDLIARFFSE
jgi:hypothetical protein